MIAQIRTLSPAHSVGANVHAQTETLRDRRTAKNKTYSDRLTSRARVRGVGGSAPRHPQTDRHAHAHTRRHARVPHTRSNTHTHTHKVIIVRFTAALHPDSDYDKLVSVRGYQLAAPWWDADNKALVFGFAEPLRPNEIVRVCLRDQVCVWACEWVFACTRAGRTSFRTHARRKDMHTRACLPASQRACERTQTNTGKHVIWHSWCAERTARRFIQGSQTGSSARRHFVGSFTLPTSRLMRSKMQHRVASLPCCVVPRHALGCGRVVRRPRVVQWPPRKRGRTESRQDHKCWGNHTRS